ncbi:hypothetical protein B0H11DRAFT_674790 [Mycena galericulata]|nr:hypothetical protein B0H11DRAFT_674790 [Mycena galericulata]
MDEDTRVEDLWFAPDAVVLRADKKIFRVTKSILAARSSVFRDMFAFPQPGNDETEMIEGSPVVSLPDSAMDVEVFLRVIFDSNYFMPPPAPVDLHDILGILRLSHKYDVPYLYRRALQHLSVRYCPSLDEYRAPRDQYRSHIGYIKAAGEPLCVRYLTIIAAAQQVGALGLLPFTYYVATKSSQDELRLAASAYNADADIVQTCLAARTQFMKGTSAVNRFLTVPSKAKCIHPAECNAIRFDRLGLHFENIKLECAWGPLEDWREHHWNIVGNQFCEHCLQEAKKAHQAALEMFWDQLPIV